MHIYIGILWRLKDKIQTKIVFKFYSDKHICNDLCENHLAAWQFSAVCQSDLPACWDVLQPPWPLVLKSQTLEDCYQWNIIWNICSNELILIFCFLVFFSCSYVTISHLFNVLSNIYIQIEIQMPVPLLTT